MIRKSSQFGLAVVVVVSAAFTTGCGYSSDRDQVFRTTNDNNTPIRTIAVDVLASREFRRGLELQLTEALAKRIEVESPYKLAKRDRADTLFTGEVLEVRQATIGRDFRAVRPRETTMTVVIRWEWKDLRTGEILAENPRFVQVVDYVRPLGEDFHHASQRSLDDMAERIVDQMDTDW